VRLFVAIELPEDVRAEVARATAPLRTLDDALRWTRTASLHLTLAFLGETPAERVPALAGALADAAAPVAPFAMALRGIGAFPALRRPRVVWVGAMAGVELVTLNARVESALAPHGYAPERRPFAPHLTVARVRGTRARRIDGLEERAGEVTLDTSLTVREVALMVSFPEPGGARYERLAGAALGGAV
jgi:2'-5' RNA ligase